MCKIRTVLSWLRVHGVALAVFGVGLIVVECVFAGSDNTFGSVAATLANWLQGSLGHVVTLTAEAVVLGYAVVKGSTAGSLLGLVIAIALSYGPSIITGIFTATL